MNKKEIERRGTIKHISSTSSAMPSDWSHCWSSHHHRNTCSDRTPSSQFAQYRSPLATQCHQLARHLSPLITSACSPPPCYIATSGWIMPDQVITPACSPPLTRTDFCKRERHTHKSSRERERGTHDFLDPTVAKWKPSLNKDTHKATENASMKNLLFCYKDLFFFIFTQWRSGDSHIRYFPFLSFL